MNAQPTTTALIPFTDAAAEFSKETGEELWVAAIYLPDAYDTCPQCITREAHEHPNKTEVTREELDEAIEAMLTSQYEAKYDL